MARTLIAGVSSRNALDALTDADALRVVTESPEFTALDWIDGRRRGCAATWWWMGGTAPIPPR